MLNRQVSQAEVRKRISDAFLPARFSIGQALHQMYSDGGLRSGPEADTCRRLAEEAGQQYDANRIMLPWSALGAQTRDMTVAGVSGSNYMVGTDHLPTINVLNGASLAQESGATIRTGLRSNVAVPKVSARPSSHWLADESTQITETQPTVGVLSAAPKSLAVLVEGARLMRVQSTELVDAVLEREFGAAAWLGIDTALVSGSGVNGEPQGLAATITPTSGTALSWATFTDMLKTCRAGGARNVSVWAGPGVEKLLRGRERFTGAGAIWGDAGVAGLPSIGTPAVPDAMLVTGDFSTVEVLIWGNPRLELNPYGDFASGKWQARLIVDVDFLFTQKAAFDMATSIT